MTETTEYRTAADISAAFEREIGVTGIQWKISQVGTSEFLKFEVGRMRRYTRLRCMKSNKTWVPIIHSEALLA